MAKTLVTHINPHLDDIAAVWLFIRFHPDFRDAQIEFVSAAAGNLPVDEMEDKVYLGVGRGKYDEHKGDLDDCAASLVWKDLKAKGFTPKDETQLGALDELVDWVRLEDLGKLKDLPYFEFVVSSFLRINGGSDDKPSRKNTELGMEILDRIFKILINKHKAQKDWEGRKEFETKWGKGVAVVSSYVNRTFCDSKEAVLYLMYDPKYKSIQYYSPKEGVDLEPIYQKVKELDPEAAWFLHQSHKMVICGSDSAPDSKPTKLSLEELVEVVKSV